MHQNLWRTPFRVSLLAGALLLCPAPRAVAADQHFDVLQVGTVTYQNVTVTTKGKDYIFFLHSKGMTNVKVAELSTETKEMLGYVIPKPKTEQATVWAKQTLAKMETPEVKELETRLQSQLGIPKGEDPALALRKLLTPQLIASVAAMCLIWYFFFSWCCYLVVKKTGQEPGALVWLPLLKVFPLLRAAGMSGWWVLAALVPILNLIASILWCINIAKARGKTVLTALFLILPPTSFLAFLYLAFSRPVGEPEEKKSSGKIELMALKPA